MIILERSHSEIHDHPFKLAPIRNWKQWACLHARRLVYSRVLSALNEIMFLKVVVEPKYLVCNRSTLSQDRLHTNGGMEPPFNEPRGYAGYVPYIIANGMRNSVPNV